MGKIRSARERVFEVLQALEGVQVRVGPPAPMVMAAVWVGEPSSEGRISLAGAASMNVPVFVAFSSWDRDSQARHVDETADAVWDALTTAGMPASVAPDVVELDEVSTVPAYRFNVQVVRP